MIASYPGTLQWDVSAAQPRLHIQRWTLSAEAPLDCTVLILLSPTEDLFGYIRDLPLHMVGSKREKKERKRDGLRLGGSGGKPARSLSHERGSTG